MHRYTFLALTLGAAGLMATSTAAAAQAGESPPAAAASDSARRMKDPITRMLEQRQALKLTDDQARRLEAIRAKYQERHKDQMEQMRRDRETRSAFRASMDSARAEVAAVLTPEQERQVEAMREEWRREWREGHRGRHGHGGEHGKKHRHHDDEDETKDG